MGVSPRESWKETKLFVPSAIEGELKLVGEYEAGLTCRIDKNKMWESYFDKKSGWYCIGNPMLEGATKVPLTMTDPRWPESEGWVKMQSVVQYADGTKTTIHIVYNETTGAFDDFKFK